MGELHSEDGNQLVIGTRSILILLTNILLGKTMKRGGGYHSVQIANCDFLTFESVGGIYYPKRRHSTVGLCDVANAGTV